MYIHSILQCPTCVPHWFLTFNTEKPLEVIGWSFFPRVDSNVFKVKTSGEAGYYHYLFPIMPISGMII